MPLWGHTKACLLLLMPLHSGSVEASRWPSRVAPCRAHCNSHITRVWMKDTQLGNWPTRWSCTKVFLPQLTPFFKQELRAQENLQTASQLWKWSSIPSKIINGIPKNWATQNTHNHWVLIRLSQRWCLPIQTHTTSPMLSWYICQSLLGTYNNMFILLWFLSGICRKVNFVGNNLVLFKEIWALTNSTTFSK